MTFTGDVFQFPKVFVQWHPVITKCHGAEKDMYVITNVINKKIFFIAG